MSPKEIPLEKIRVRNNFFAQKQLILIFQSLLKRNSRIDKKDA